MLLTDFLHDLLTTGEVSLHGEPADFGPDDLLNAEALLRAYHADDALSLPHTAPAFEAPAALWAAGCLYYTVLLALLRQLDAAEVLRRLPDYPQLPSPAAAYSIDLIFRYLPDLLALARGLAPADVLVTRLRELAARWPLSFVGRAEPVEPVAEQLLLAHPALAQEYVDRIIRAQDRARAAQPHLRPLVQAALGAHAAQLWPDFHDFVLVD